MILELSMVLLGIGMIVIGITADTYDMLIEKNEKINKNDFFKNLLLVFIKVNKLNILKKWLSLSNGKNPYDEFKEVYLKIEKNKKLEFSDSFNILLKNKNNDINYQISDKEIMIYEKIIEGITLRSNIAKTFGKKEYFQSKDNYEFIELSKEVEKKKEKKYYLEETIKTRSKALIA